MIAQIGGFVWGRRPPTHTNPQFLQSHTVSITTLTILTMRVLIRHRICGNETRVTLECLQLSGSRP